MNKKILIIFFLIFLGVFLINARASKADWCQDSSCSGEYCSSSCSCSGGFYCCKYCPTPTPESYYTCTGTCTIGCSCGTASGTCPSSLTCCEINCPTSTPEPTDTPTPTPSPTPRCDCSPQPAPSSWYDYCQNLSNDPDKNYCPSHQCFPVCNYSSCFAVKKGTWGCTSEDINCVQLCDGPPNYWSDWSCFWDSSIQSWVETRYCEIPQCLKVAQAHTYCSLSVTPGAGTAYPTTGLTSAPSNTPPVTCGPLGLPAPSPVVCNGNTATLYWGPGNNANFYSLRVDNTADTWDGSCSSPYGDFCKDVNNSPYGPFAITPGVQYGAWIHSRCGGNFSASASFPYFTCPTLTLTPSPTPLVSPYPTVHISGILEQKTGEACYQSNSSNPFSGVSVAVIPASPLCVTPVCQAMPNTEGKSWNYYCNITFDNQGCVGGAPTPFQTLGLSAHAADYQAGRWGDPPNGTSCWFSSLEITSFEPISKDIIFPFGQDNWVKLKNASFSSSGTNVNYIPAIVNPYDGDDTADKVFNLFTGSEDTNTGVSLGIEIGANGQYSKIHNWHDEAKNYSSGANFTPGKYMEYVKSLKEYKVITALNEIDADGIYIIEGNSGMTVNTADFGAHKVVLIYAGGTATIDGVSNTFNTAGHSLAIIANKISFNANLTEAKGIFIANTIDTGAADDRGLKITGNLVALSAFDNGRARADASRPAIFIIGSPDMYVDLLPYLSKNIYDWRPLQ